MEEEKLLECKIKNNTEKISKHDEKIESLNSAVTNLQQENVKIRSDVDQTSVDLNKFIQSLDKKESSFIQKYQFIIATIGIPILMWLLNNFVIIQH